MRSVRAASLSLCNQSLGDLRFAAGTRSRPNMHCSGDMLFVTRNGRLLILRAAAERSIEVDHTGSLSGVLHHPARGIAELS